MYFHLAVDHTSPSDLPIGQNGDYTKEHWPCEGITGGLSLYEAPVVVEGWLGSIFETRGTDTVQVLEYDKQ